MHQGSFPPQRQVPASKSRYLPGTWSPAQLDPELSPPDSDRRRWLLGAGCVAVGLTVTWGLFKGGDTGDQSGRSPPSSGPPLVGTPEWAETMFDATAAELMKWSGDLERASFMAPDDPRFVACFESMLDAAVRDGTELADLAGACAVRSLARLGHTRSVRTRAREIQSKAGMLQTRVALENAIPELFEAPR